MIKIYPKIPTPGFMKFCNFCQAEHELISSNYFFKKKSNPLCKLHAKKYTIDNKIRFEDVRRIARNAKRAQPEVQKKLKEYQIVYSKEYRSKEKNKDKLKSQRPKHRQTIKERKKTDPAFKLKMDTRARIRQALKDGPNKAYGTWRLLGYDIEVLKCHIESQFEPWMIWENRGQFTWHIDHIIPLSYFGDTLLDNIRVAFHWKNHRPLDWRENLQKSDTVEQWQLDLLEEIKRDVANNK